MNNKTGQIAMIYAGWNDETTPTLEDGVLCGYDIDEEIELDLSNGTYQLVPGFATGAREDAVIRVIEVNA